MAVDGGIAKGRSSAERENDRRKVKPLPTFAVYKGTFSEWPP